MRSLSHLFENNKVWAGNILHQNPEFFLELSQQQKPEYQLGCAVDRS
jgi:carbonic anhydrase